MKKALRILTAVLAVLLTIPLVGCSVFNVFSVDSLIKSPRLTGENSAIQKAFENAVGKDTVLVRPVSGEYRSAYVLHDYDADGLNEAIVFYTPKDIAGEVRMHILKCDSDTRKWKTVSDVKGNGSDVYSVSFCNFDRDSVSEIAVAWAFADGQKDRMLTVYRYENNKEKNSGDFVGLASVRMSDYGLVDVDFDGADELLYLSADSSSEKPSATLKSLKFDLSSKRFVPLSEIQLDTRIVSFIGHTHDLQSGNRRFYIDCMLPDGKRMTEIVYYDYQSSAFVRPVDRDGKPLGLASVRKTPDIAEDINGDGSVEIPFSEVYKQSEILFPKEGHDNTVYLTEYRNFDGEKLNSVGQYYVCSELGIRIKIDKYKDTAYIKLNNADKSIMFYSYQTGALSANRLLFTVSQKNKGGRKNHEIIKSELSDTISVIVTKSGQDLGITADSVKDDIRFISERS